MSRPLIEARGVMRRYAARGLLGRGRPVHAVVGVDLELAPGESLGLVGESGSGKSTLTRILLGLERPDRGVVRFDGHDLASLASSERRALWRRMGAVFQDPTASLDPRLRIASSIAEPLTAHRVGDVSRRQRRVAELLELVGLPADVGARLPSALSGGERQRVAIARALAGEPDLLVLDEPISSLDLVVGARVLALVERLRARFGLAVLLVSHDLDVVGRFCSRVVVMDRGEVVEQGVTEHVLTAPRHPSTRALLAARLQRGALPEGFRSENPQSSSAS